MRYLLIINLFLLISCANFEKGCDIREYECGHKIVEKIIPTSLVDEVKSKLPELEIHCNGGNGYACNAIASYYRYIENKSSEMDYMEKACLTKSMSFFCSFAADEILRDKKVQNANNLDSLNLARYLNFKKFEMETAKEECERSSHSKGKISPECADYQKLKQLPTKEFLKM